MKSTTPAAHAVLLAPVVSEKSYSLTEAGKYTFEVHPDAHKTQVRQAVEEIFGVTVVDVVNLSENLLCSVRHGPI